MPKSFTFNEVKEIITNYKSLFKKSEEIKNYPNKMDQESLLKIKSLKISNTMEKWVTSNLNGKDSKDDNSILLLLLSLYCYMKGSAIDNYTSSLNETYSADIKSNFDILKNVNPLKWVFTSAKNKEIIEDSFKFLKEQQDAFYYQEINHNYDKINNLKQVSLNDVSNDFNDHKNDYRDALNKISSQTLLSTNTINIINILNNQYNDINSKIDTLNNSLIDDKNNVVEGVNKLVGLSLVNQLKAIDLDDINRDKKGLRIKALKDAGYLNYADVFGAEIEELESVSGISWDGAASIKKAVEDAAKALNKNIKIKLSYDDQSKENTVVVKAIYKYIKDQEILSKVNNRTDLNDDINALLNLRDGFIWLFLEDGEKNEIIDTYNYTKEQLESIKSLYLEAKDDYDKQAKVTKKTAWDYFKDNSIKFFNVIEELCPGVLGNDDSIYGLPEQLAREIQEQCYFPDGLNCTLRRYQEWGVKYILHQERVLLGDEMGLGKTIQAIASMVSLKNVGAKYFLVVCPASVVTNWCREVYKQSKLRAIKIHGTGKMASFNAWLNVGGVGITTYETTGILKFPENFKVDEIVVDEAHYIKNPDARRSINTKALCQYSDRLLFMTGTALENNVNEMINLMGVLQPKVAQEAEKMASFASAPIFREKVIPVYYRRKREDVLTELPEKIESEEWLEMGPEEESVYEGAIMAHAFMQARRLSWSVENLEKSCKATRLKEIVEEAENDDRKVIVFSFFKDTIRAIYKFLRGRCLNPIDGSLNPARRQEIIDEFDEAPAGTVLLAQIQSGGTGLNIQAASVVVICEPQLKPSIENQAISRAYRMGQARNVLVYRLLCEESIDEKIMALLEEKQKIFDAFADKSLAANIEIDNNKINDIIEEEIERIKKKKGMMPNKDNASYYDAILNLSYDELIKALNKRYDTVKGDYFENEDCLNVNLNIQKDDLFIHHIDEDKGILLEKTNDALNYSYDYQKANRLVYCDYLEHLLLHVKIIENNQDKSKLQDIFNSTLSIIKDINTYYGEQGSIDSSNKAILKIKTEYKSYIAILNKINQLIQSNELFQEYVTKKALALNWDNDVIDKIYNDIK